MKDNKIRVLRENYKNEESDISFVEYVKLCSESDPGFFRWLFDDDDLEDFDECDHAEEWEQFLAGLRFVLQPSDRQPDWWVCTDTEHNIVCRFESHRFNDTQDYTLLDGDTFASTEEAIAHATYLREMADWLRENHYDKVF